MQSGTLGRHLLPGAAAGAENKGACESQHTMSGGEKAKSLSFSSLLKTKVNDEVESERADSGKDCPLIDSWRVRVQLPATHSALVVSVNRNWQAHGSDPLHTGTSKLSG